MAAEPPTGAKGEVRIEEPTPAERAVIRRAAESRATVPVLELSVSSPAEGVVATERVVAACARALREHPRANGSYRDGRFELYSRVNIGVLMSTEQAYAIPTVFDADQKAPAELAREIEDLAGRLNAGTLAPPALSGATFTVWNAAELGFVSAATPVIPSQAASLAVGLRDLTLSCDHRILYGVAAAQFLKAVAHDLDGQRV